MSGGPPHEPPERLFRALLALRPERSIPWRLVGAEHIPIRVRALRAVEQSLASDAGFAVEHDERRAGVIELELLARSVWTPDGPAFGSAEEVALLDEAQLSALADEALPVLAAIAPTFARCDMEAWKDTLVTGAMHPTNLHEAVVLASCVDHNSERILARPDRYWGVPFCDLLDGHWMVYRAARTAAERLAPRRSR
jgi:hypothetical protein